MLMAAVQNSARCTPAPNSASLDYLFGRTGNATAGRTHHGQSMLRLRQPAGSPGRLRCTPRPDQQLHPAASVKGQLRRDGSTGPHRLRTHRPSHHRRTVILDATAPYYCSPLAHPPRRLDLSCSPPPTPQASPQRRPGRSRRSGGALAVQYRDLTQRPHRDLRDPGGLRPPPGWQSHGDAKQLRGPHSRQCRLR